MGWFMVYELREFFKHNMHTVTWKPGSNPFLDSLFDELREKQYKDRSHRLWENYSKTSFEYAGIVAYTICFDDNNMPEMCSSISNRDCWPDCSYRILNRTWKHSNKKPIMKQISAAMGEATLSQIAWLKENTNCNLYFISRQTDNWMTWVTRNFKRQFNLDFTIAKNKYLTCPNECDDTCWQHIIYNGPDEILNSWKSR
jgi:hypothetical protein